MKTQSTPAWSSSNKSDGKARVPTLSSGGMKGCEAVLSGDHLRAGE